MIKIEELKKIVGESYIRCLTKEEFGKILELFKSELSIDEWDKFDTYTIYNDLKDVVLKSFKGVNEILAKDVIKEFENTWLIEDGEIIKPNSTTEFRETNKKLENILGKNSNIHINKTFPNILERPNSQDSVEEKTRKTLERIDDFIKDSFEKTKENHTLEKLGDNQKVTKEELEQELKKALKKDRTCKNNCSTVCGECQISPNNIPIGEEYIEYVHHPNHYGGENNVYEAIKIIEAHDLNFVEGNVVKYLLRYKKKNGFEDLEKALWYLNRLVENYKKNN